jgi:hypothetical protein
VSSILRALKKLENEPRHLEGTQPLDSKFVPLADTGTQRPVSSILMVVVGGGIMCGLVILAGWWLFSEKPAMPFMEEPPVQETIERVTEQEPVITEKPVFQPIATEDIYRAEEQASEETVPVQETPAKTAAIEIPKLNDPDMKLQAVTWSRTPQKRIAVINNRILREGEVVSGYLINSINQDDVVLSREGAKWKLLFR